MNGNKTITANFNAPATQYTLTTYVMPPTAGTVTLNPPGGIYDAGTVVTLTASPMANYTFSSWTGLGLGDTSTGNVASIHMNNNKYVEAHFNPLATQYTLTTLVTPIGAGTLTLNPPGGIYDAGIVVTLTATPNTGYGFNSWMGLWAGDTSNGNVATILMNGNKNVEAHFNPLATQYTLTPNVTPIGAGTIILNPPGGVYNAGTAVTLTATPNTDYVFSSWTGLGLWDTSNGNVASIMMNSNKIITANFTQTSSQQYTLTTSVNPPAVGTITLDPSGGIYNAGTIVTLRAAPNPGYTFNSWSGLGTGDTSIGNVASILMNGNKSITANFNSPMRYTLTTSANPPSAGAVTLNPPGGIYDAGTVVTLTANPTPPTYTFSSWSGVDSSNGSTATVIMNSNRTVTANFTIIAVSTIGFNPPSFSFIAAVGGPNPASQTLSVWNSGGGTLNWAASKTKSWLSISPIAGVSTDSGNPNSITVSVNISGLQAGTYNDSITISAFGASNSPQTAPVTLILSQSCVYTLTVNINPQWAGTVTKNPDKSTFCPSEQVTLIVTPNSGYTFSSWNGVDSSSGTTAYVTMNRNRTVTANFTAISETISPPSTPIGPASGVIDTSYTYSTGGSSSNLGHSVQYFFDWGDGTNSGWLPIGTISASHSWSSAGNYTIKTKARCATDTSVVSVWSSGLLVTISTTGGGGTINLPETGQTKCYNALGTEIDCSGTGQDGEIQAGVAWPSPRFTVSGECVTDNLTGLMWAKNGYLANGTRTWQGALTYVASLNNTGGLCGYTDWRLPNVNELESLISAGEHGNATWLISQGFSNVQMGGGGYWSSTTYAYDTSLVWTVGMWDGNVTGTSNWGGCDVWPVRSGQSGAFQNSDIWKTGQTISHADDDDGDLEKGVAWPTPRFTDLGDGTITDNLTGLIWTKDANAPGPASCSPATTKTWQEALDYVKCLNNNSYLGHNDWCLPNRKELFSLIDRSRYSPALPAGHPFQHVQSNSFLERYWSSTTRVAGTGYAFSVSMSDGTVDYGDKSDSYAVNRHLYVWPVRGMTLGTTETVSAPSTPSGSTSGTVGTSYTYTTGGSTSNLDHSVQYFFDWGDGTNSGWLAVGTTSTSNSWISAGNYPIKVQARCATDTDIVSNWSDTLSVNITRNPTLTVLKSGIGSGTVTSSPGGIDCGNDCTEVYAPGTKVTLRAKADTNSAFTGWSGGGCSGTGTCAVVMNGDTAVTAAFSTKAPAISVSSSSINFGSVKVWKKITKKLKIANNGSGDLMIAISGIGGTDFSIMGTSNIIIKAKKSYSLSITFKPTSTGLKTTTLNIDSNDTGTPLLNIPLSGTGQ
jgi:hypothetical protein